MLNWATPISVQSASKPFSLFCKISSSMANLHHLHYWNTEIPTHPSLRLHWHHLAPLSLPLQVPFKPSTRTEEICLLLHRLVNNSGLAPVKTLVLKESTLFNLFAMLTQIEGRVKKKEMVECQKRKELVYITSSELGESSF